jgi:hypothetical protein
MFEIHVECGEDDQGEPAPRRLDFGDRAIDVAEIVDRWLGADHRYFKVKGQDGAAFILRHDIGRGRWQLIFFDRRSA